MAGKLKGTELSYSAEDDVKPRSIDQLFGRVGLQDIAIKFVGAEIDVVGQRERAGFGIDSKLDSTKGKQFLIACRTLGGKKLRPLRRGIKQVVRQIPIQASTLPNDKRQANNFICFANRLRSSPSPDSMRS